MSDNTAALTEILNAPEPAAEATPSTPVADAQAPSTPSTPATPPFLEIDGRTKYNTAEDAKKGWSELQTHASEARKFKEAAEQWGIKDPAAINQLFQELVEFRSKAQPSSATPNGANRSDKATVDKAAAGDPLAYDSLSPEWKAHVDYLNKMGYVTEDKLKPIQDRLAQLDAKDAAAQEAHVQAARDAGVTILDTLIARDKLPIDDVGKARIAKAIESEIVDTSRDERGKIIPNSAEDRYLRGNPTERNAIIEEHYKWFLEFGDKYAVSKNASYVAAKTNAQASQPRTMPSSTGPSSSERPKGPMSAEDRVKRLSAHFDQAGFQK